jgi:threonine aldolase
MIDLRSDTVTRPGPGMLEAMVSAEVGDDVFGEDPTVIELQERVATLLGKEASLFVPSGVMSNQLALRCHTSPGDEVILESGCHIANYESGAAGAISGVQLRTVEGSKGILSADSVASAVRSGYYWEPSPRLVCIENTHNKAGGVVYPRKVVEDIATVVREKELLYHLDGARIWNAGVASGVSEKDLCMPFDSVSVCLSKGLGAPVGSLLAGSSSFIKRAHRFRKMFGGGMRQVGILAAAGLYALEHNRADLETDHRNASLLAAGLARLDAFSVDPEQVETNIVMFDVTGGRNALTTIDQMKRLGVLMVPFGPNTIRATTHRDIERSDIQLVLELLESSFG